METANHDRTLRGAPVGQADGSPVTDADDSSFWEFSNRIYGLDGVADACLRLQNGPGTDVNLLLFCCWTGTTIGVVPESAMGDAMAESAEWAENVVRPLRQVRTWMKNTMGESELRDRIKHDELEAERIQQQQLESLVEPATMSGKGIDAVVENLDRYLKRSGVRLDDNDRADLEVLIQAAVGFDAVG